MMIKIFGRRGFQSALVSLVLATCLVPARGVILTETFTFNNLNQAVPDGSVTGLANQQSLTSSIQSITSMSVALQVSGGFNGDLYAYVSHGSAYSVLLDRTGRTAINSAGYSDTGFNVTFSDAAANGDIHTYRNTSVPAFGSPLTGTWQPDARTANPSTVTDMSARTNFLSGFNGAGGAENWTLFLADVNSASAASSPSTLAGWGLTLTGQGYGSLAFDANTSATGVQDGAGVWDTTTANWHDGTKNVVWSNTFYDTAVFGAGSGAAGTVTVGTVNANAITLNAAGSGNYSLTGGTITLGTLASGPTPTITANADATISSTLTGTSGVIKAGNAVLTLSGANTYSGGTTISAGTLLVNNTSGSGTGTGAVTVNSGGTLGGGNAGGTVGFINAGANTVRVSGGGAIAPGAASSAVGALTLTATSVAFTGASSSSLATLAIDLSGNTNDLLKTSGALDLSSAFDQLLIAQTGSQTLGKYTIATYTGTLSGTFDFVTGLSGYTVDYSTAGEIDLIAAVPEPSTWMAGFLALATLGYSQRRRLRAGWRKRRTLRVLAAVQVGCVTL